MLHAPASFIQIRVLTTNNPLICCPFEHRIANCCPGRSWCCSEMIPSDSGVLSKYTSHLKDVALVAHAIDQGLRELETVLGSVENLMPCEENQPQALEAMNSVEQEVKDMEEATGLMLVELQKILSHGQLEVQKARETNKSIEEGLLLIEGTLEKYGYDGSKMPAFTPPNPNEDAANASESEERGELSEDDEPSIVESGTSDSPSTLSLQKNAAQTPAHQMLRIRVETMAGAEVTPDVLSSKLRIGDNSYTPSPSIIRVSPNNPFKVKSPSVYSEFLSPLPNAESVPKKTELSISRPVRPVLSTTSFD